MNDTPTLRLPVDACLLPNTEVSIDFFATIIDHIAQPIFVKDRDFRFVLLNRAVTTVLGFPRNVMLGRTDYDFFPAHEADAFRLKDLEVFERGQTVRIEEETITDVTGERHVLATSKVPVFDKDGKVSHLVGIIHDITQLKRAEGALVRLNEELEQRVKERTAALENAQSELMRRERLALVGQVAGAIAHQIRNPLGAIKNAAYLLKIAFNHIVPDANESLAIIHDEVARANQIITDLLEYARISPPVCTRVSLEYIVAQSLGGASVQSNVHVHCDVSSDVMVTTDARQMQSAIFKVIRSALDSMPDGGELRITGQQDSTCCSLVIADTGFGLPHEVQEQLRDPLRSHGTRITLGLQLLAARALLENLGGTLQIAPVPIRGTQFTIRVLREIGEVLNFAQCPFDKKIHLAFFARRRVLSFFLSHGDQSKFS
jgi:PAS domain S-box-containing protein